MHPQQHQQHQHQQYVDDRYAAGSSLTGGRPLPTLPPGGGRSGGHPGVAHQQQPPPPQHYQQGGYMVHPQQQQQQQYHPQYAAHPQQHPQQQPYYHHPQYQQPPHPSQHPQQPYYGSGGAPVNPTAPTPVAGMVLRQHTPQFRSDQQQQQQYGGGSGGGSGEGPTTPRSEVFAPPEPGRFGGTLSRPSSSNSLRQLAQSQAMRTASASASGSNIALNQYQQHQQYQQPQHQQHQQQQLQHPSAFSPLGGGGVPGRTGSPRASNVPHLLHHANTVPSSGSAGNVGHRAAHAHHHPNGASSDVEDGVSSHAPRRSATAGSDVGDDHDDEDDDDSDIDQNRIGARVTTKRTGHQAADNSDKESDVSDGEGRQTGRSLRATAASRTGGAGGAGAPVIGEGFDGQYTGPAAVPALDPSSVSSPSSSTTVGSRKATPARQQHPSMDGRSSAEGGRHSQASHTSADQGQLQHPHMQGLENDMARMSVQSAPSGQNSYYQQQGHPHGYDPNASMYQQQQQQQQQYMHAGGPYPHSFHGSGPSPHVSMYSDGGSVRGSVIPPHVAQGGAVPGSPGMHYAPQGGGSGYYGHPSMHGGVYTPDPSMPPQDPSTAAAQGYMVQQVQPMYGGYPGMAPPQAPYAYAEQPSRLSDAQSHYEASHIGQQSRATLVPGRPSTAGGANNSSSTVIAERNVPTLDGLEAYLQNAKKTGDPRVQLDFAKYLLEASANLLKTEPDQKAANKRREHLTQEAIKMLKKLSSSGSAFGKPASAEAMFFLGNCYNDGALSVPVDHEKAFGLYQQAAKQNHSSATYRAAVCYEYGRGTRKDASRSVQYYRKAAQLSDVPAMFKLGMILLKGLLGQQANPREAITWLKRAADGADAENPHALHELASCYENGGIPSILVDEAHAKDLYTQAAQLGYVYSMFKLGVCYEFGKLGCPVDPRRSIAWYTKAAERGYADAELALAGWYLTGSEGVLQQSDTEAYLWARRAADKGLAKAEYAVGYFSEQSIGVQQDVAEARRWYLRAAAQGNKRAMNRLADLKKHGMAAVAAQKHQRATRSGKGGVDESCSIM
ncbi:hypothetical protein GQ42DRAFT_164485 [Ramicandelaber brevisporus]|nr:hypothetical protein GQ42DRAFT_164485 [Ramicandelaber brevisporus]